MPTHGSLTKAGKVRNQTPKIPSTNKKNGIPKQEIATIIANASSKERLRGPVEDDEDVNSRF